MSRGGVNWSQQDIDRLYAPLTDAKKEPVRVAASGKARGKHVAGQMNKVETAFAAHLELRRIAREVRRYWFEQWTWKLAADCRFTPDFVAEMADSSLRVYEVKGRHNSKIGKYYAEDDSKVKIRVFASMFPVQAFIVFKDGGNWAEERIQSL
jgi:hypothetical protein